MNVLINVVVPVFGIILTGYLAGRLEVLGSDSAAALNRFVFYFALPPALFIFMARAPIDKIFNWPFIGGSVLTLLIALFVGRFWFRHDVATLTLAGLAAVFGNVFYMGLRSFLRPTDRMGHCRRSLQPSASPYCSFAVASPSWRAHAHQALRRFV